jgi:serine protease Do
VVQKDALPKLRKSSATRHRKLLASVTGLGAVALLAGPGYYYPSSFRILNSSAQAAETLQQKPSGFADLVAKVKPAVVSVRVKINTVTRSQLLRGSRLEKFLRRSTARR